MIEKVITVINIICSLSVIVPLCVCILYSRLVLPSLIHILIYAVVAFFTELTSLIAVVVFNFAIPYSALLFTLFEAAIVCSMLAYWNKEKFKIYYGVLIVYSIIWLSYGVLAHTPNYNVIFGALGISSILVCLFFLLETFGKKVPVWMLIIVGGVLFYKVFNIAIFAFMNFFMEPNNASYIIYYNLINAIANAGLYLLMSIGIIKCKKQFSPASLL